MSVCAVCGNKKKLQAIFQGTNYVFQCMECIIDKLAPHCAVCNCRIIGHDMESEDNHCCAHCASTQQAA